MMFDFGSTLFWYKLLFMAELIVGELVFAVNLRRRKNFLLRLSCTIFGLFVFAFLLPILGYNAWWTCLMFFIMFFAFLCGIKLCFDESWWNVVFCGLAAYTVQHIAFVVFGSLTDVAATALGTELQANFYSQDSAQVSGISIAISVSIYLASYFVTYMIAHYAYTDKIQPSEASRLGRTHFVVLAGFIIITDNIFNSITMFNDKIDIVSLWLERGYNIITCVLSLQLQFSQLTEKEIQKKYNTVEHILREEQKQYEIVKQNLDTMNIKCHDMKHYLRAIKTGGAQISNQEIDEIEKVLSIYESVVKTGNETLDLILAEKNLMNHNKVKITCIADGAQLNFMCPTDMYSLFGNALENAIESVAGLDESKRNISLVVKSVGNMVSIHVENYFEGKRKLNGDLPQTLKEDKNYHGFGMLSMKMITKKYGGSLVVEITDDIFNLNILIPKNQNAAR